MTGMRLKAAADFFLVSWPAEAPSPGTVRSYSAHVHRLVQFANARGAELLSDLTPELLRAAVREALSENTDGRPVNFKGGEASAALMVAAVRCMTRWLAEQGIPVTDLSKVKAPRVPERVQPRVTWDEFERMQRAVLERLISGRVPRAAITRDLALLNVLAETGLRANEVACLTVRDVDLGNGLLTVRRAKGKKDRVLSIQGSADDPDPKRVLRLLDQWLEVRNRLRGAQKHAYLFTSMKGGPLSADGLRQVLGRICLQAGVEGKRTPHSFRRWQFSERYRADPTALPRLTARMGWSDRSHKMVDVYTRGVEVDFARDRIALLTSRAPVSPSHQPAPQPADDRVATMLAQISSDAQLRRELLQALLGGAA